VRSTFLFAVVVMYFVIEIMKIFYIAEIFLHIVMASQNIFIVDIIN